MTLPLDLTTPAGPTKLAIILENAAQDAKFFGGDQFDEDGRRQYALWLVTHPEHLVWEVWRGEEFVGILLLRRITPKVDALLHFAFFDRNLVGKVKLLRQFLRYCFEDLGFQRISMEVPEFVDQLVSFIRRKLAFRFEGEAAVRAHPLFAELHAASKPENLHVWIAKHGSRRQRAYWRNGVWHDVLCLRLTAPEFRGLTTEG